MLFGVCLPHHRPIATPDLIQAAAQQIEALGFASIWLSDHIATPNAPDQAHRRIFFEPLAVAAYLAAATIRPRIGFSVLVVPYREAIVTAKQLATIDALSGGRLTLGVGVGGLRGEFETLGVPFADRGKLTDEYLRAMRELWTNDDPRFAGERIRFRDITFWPKPVQRPGPPILVGGRSPRALRRAAELGDGWQPSTQPSAAALKAGIDAYRAACAEAGRPTDQPIVYRTEIRLHSIPSPARPFFSGTPAEIVEDIRIAADLGVTELALDFALPAITTGEEWLATVDRFADEVRAVASG